jgi:hypothetical protein
VMGKRGQQHGSGLGKFRWYVERTIAWFHSFGRLRRRLDRLTEIQDAFLRLACSLHLFGILDLIRIHRRACRRLLGWQTTHMSVAGRAL